MRKLHINNKFTLRETTSFHNYLEDISGIELFTPEEEHDCAERAFAGDENAVDELVRRNLRFVVSVAKQYSNTAAHIEDLINEGNIGLIYAVRKFDPSKGFKFITFAVWWIRKIIVEYLSNNSKLVRLPANKVTAIMKLTRQKDLLEQTLNRRADITEIIEFCQSDDMNSEDIKQLDRINNISFDSLDREVGGSNDCGVITLGETITGDYNPTDHNMIQEGIKFDINRYLSCLKPKAKIVIVSFFGLDGNTPMSLSEIGEEMGLTREMIRQIKVKSLVILKNAMKSSSIIN